MEQSIHIRANKIIHSPYLFQVMTSGGLKEAVDNLYKVLRLVQGDFDAIAFRGYSGALVAPVLANKLKKDLILVRKGEKCHTNLIVEGVECDKYIIVDDQIATGATVRAIIKEISGKKSPIEATLAGIALYNRGETQSSLDDIASRFDVWAVGNGVKNISYPARLRERSRKYAKKRSS